MSMDKVDDWALPKISQDYVDALNDAGEYSKAASHKVAVGHLQMKKRLFIEHDLGGDVTTLGDPDRSEDTVAEYLKIDGELIELERRAFEAVRGVKSDTPVFDDMAEKYKDLEFLRDDKGRFTEVMSGWYQNIKGDLYHYDGVVWDNVPDEQIKDLEFLGG